MVDISLLITDFNAALFVEKERFCIQTGLLQCVSGG
ncbi:MAG: hypothetical protein H6Q93_353 [Nitrospirae bacterium]|nr:hypothetical protein [Nitrospirota bacterium]